MIETQPIFVHFTSVQILQTYEVVQFPDCEDPSLKELRECSQSDPCDPYFGEAGVGVLRARSQQPRKFVYSHVLETA
jgi:hypothetical protein